MSSGEGSQRKTNSLDAYGRIRLCRVCGSRFHFAAKCPDGDSVLMTDASGDGRMEF